MFGQTVHYHFWSSLTIYSTVNSNGQRKKSELAFAQAYSLESSAQMFGKTSAGLNHALSDS